MAAIKVLSINGWCRNGSTILGNVLGEACLRAGRQFRRSDRGQEIFFTEQRVIAKSIIPLG